MTEDAAEFLIKQLRLEGIRNERVLAAIAATPRENFISEDLHDAAYENRALPINCGQTISQPYVVARMSEAIMARGSPKTVLEVGTGSGYQTAILSQLFDSVYSIERIKYLFDMARNQLQDNSNLHLRYGDGYEGWPEYAPFDRIIVTAAAREVPDALFEQLSSEQGEMVIPVGENYGQQLQLIKRQGDELNVESLGSVVFVPMLRSKE